MKEFFLITQVFYPDEVSTANLFTNLCEELSKDNEIRVKVWSAQPSYSSNKRQARTLNYNNIEIGYIPSTSFKKNNLIGRLINYLTFTLSVVFNLLFSKSKTPVFTHTTPPSLGIIIAFICKLKKRPFNYVLLDIFPDGLIRLGKLNAKNFLVRFWRKIHKLALKRCNNIIVIGRDMERWLLNFLPDVSQKVIYVPIWQDANLIKPKQFDQNNFVSKYALNNKFVVQYSGNMGMWNDMESLGKLSNNEVEGIIFMFIGGGMRKKELINAIDDPNDSNIMFFPFLSNEEYAESVTACNVALISLHKSLEGMAVPSKIMGIMAAGIPILAMVPKESEIAYIINESKCGIYVEPDNINLAWDAILRLKQDEELRVEMGKNGRKAFENNYTTKIIAEHYKKLI